MRSHVVAVAPPGLIINKANLSSVSKKVDDYYKAGKKRGPTGDLRTEDGQQHYRKRSVSQVSDSPTLTAAYNVSNRTIDSNNDATGCTFSCCSRSRNDSNGTSIKSQPSQRPRSLVNSQQQKVAYTSLKYGSTRPEPKALSKVRLTLWEAAQDTPLKRLGTPAKLNKEWDDLPHAWRQACKDQPEEIEYNIVEEWDTPPNYDSALDERDGNGKDMELSVDIDMESVNSARETENCELLEEYMDGDRGDMQGEVENFWMLETDEPTLSPCNVENIEIPILAVPAAVSAYHKYDHEYARALTRWGDGGYCYGGLFRNVTEGLVVKDPAITQNLTYVENMIMKHLSF
eukprot:CFRG6739T1